MKYNLIRSFIGRIFAVGVVMTLAACSSYPELSGDAPTTLTKAPEYVIGDMISPFKAVMGGAYKDVEARLQAAIHLRVGLAATTPVALKRAIKQADGIVAYFEATQLAGFDIKEAARFFGRPSGFSTDQLDLDPLPVIAAQSKFLNRLKEVEAMVAN